MNIFLVLNGTEIMIIVRILCVIYTSLLMGHKSKRLCIIQTMNCRSSLSIYIWFISMYLYFIKFCAGSLSHPVNFNTFLVPFLLLFCHYTSKFRIFWERVKIYYELLLGNTPILPLIWKLFLIIFHKIIITKVKYSFQVCKLTTISAKCLWKVWSFISFVVR